jgi:hypothetical protein
LPITTNRGCIRREVLYIRRELGTYSAGINNRLRWWIG